MSFLHGFSLARQKNACTYSTGLSHSSYNILRLIIVELLDAPVHQNIFMSQIVALPSNYQTPSLVLSQLQLSVADAENSDLVAAWRYRLKVEIQIHQCIRLNMSQQRKKTFIIG